MAKKMEWQEKIARIEQAPKEMQTMVAKAFLREDINDENVQYLFNTDGLDVLNEDGENENINAEMPEGIGAAGFTIRTYKPSNNKNYITTGSGGWNTCIKGYPMDSTANVLANCVGYASGRFNEIINNARDTSGCTYKTLNCNAWYFKEMAEAAGLKTGSEPRVGAIMCWGKTGDAGHVAIVEKVISSTQVYTSESGYGSSYFWNSTRNKGNGNWGAGGSYYFRCFIYLPDDVQRIIGGNSGSSVDPFPGVSNEELARRVWNGEFGNGEIRKVKLGNRYAAVQALVDQGIGKSSNSAPVSTPSVSSFQIGDKVTIIGTGNGSSYGTSNTAYGIGWPRQILNIWEGRAFPYQVGDSTGTTGFYKASALRKR